MTDDNGQEPDMSDKEFRAANEYAIRSCHFKYVDNKELITEAISTLDDQTIEDLVYFLKENALCQQEKFVEHGFEETMHKAFNKMGAWLLNTHGI